MLDAVYVDTVEEKSIVAIRPKPAFRLLFEVANTREGSGVVLINEPPLANNEPEAADLCFWWRRGRVELPVQKALWPDVLQAYSELFVSRFGASSDRISATPADVSLATPYRH